MYMYIYTHIVKAYIVQYIHKCMYIYFNPITSCLTELLDEGGVDGDFKDTLSALRPDQIRTHHPYLHTCTFIPVHTCIYIVIDSE